MHRLICAIKATYQNQLDILGTWIGRPQVGRQKHEKLSTRCVRFKRRAVSADRKRFDSSVWQNTMVTLLFLEVIDFNKSTCRKWGFHRYQGLDSHRKVDLHASLFINFLLCFQITKQHEMDA
jgi:hypothetical protein